MPITVKACNGRAWTYIALEDAVINANRSFPIDRLKYGFLRHWLTSDRHDGWGFGAGDEVCFYDETGLLIPVWKVKETYYNLPEIVRNPPRRYRWWKDHVKPEHFRRFPVPGSGGCRRSGHYRHIRTLQETRANWFDEDIKEFNIKPRKSRTNLPNARDDIYRSDGRIKNWKKHRDHQWKTCG